MRTLGLLLGGLLLTGCVVSVAEVIPAASATYDARLVGQWVEVEGKDRAVVERDGNGYLVTYTDGDGKVGRYEAHLGRLGRQMVLDLTPATRESVPALPESVMLIRGHMLLATTIGADTVRVALLKLDSLRAALVRGTVRLSYHNDNGQLVLTDGKDALARALSAYIDRPGVLDEPGTFRRVRP